MATYTQAFKDLEKMVQEDIRDLQTRLKIPKIDGKEFSQQLFMSMIESRLVSVQKYIQVARKYMHPKSPPPRRQRSKPKRLFRAVVARAKTISSPSPWVTHLFWLKHAGISSELGSSEMSGNIKGDILNLTTDQAFINKPTEIKLAGDFPKQNVYGVDAVITLDHRTEQAQDGLRLKVAKFPTGTYTLSDSKDVKLAIAESTGSSQLVAAYVNEEITVDIKNQFNGIKYDLDAKNKIVKETIDAILKGIPMIDLNAKVAGTFTNFT